MIFRTGAMAESLAENRLPTNGIVLLPSGWAKVTELAFLAISAG